MNLEPSNVTEWREQYDTDQHPDSAIDTPERGLSIADLAWHARRYQARSRQLDALARAADEMRAEIDEWEAGQARPILQRHAWHKATLEAHAEQHHATTGQAHLDLPGGTRVQRRAGRLTVRVDDLDAAAAWLAEHCPDALAPQPPKIVKTAVTERLGAKAAEAREPGDWPAIDATTGEIVPGLTLERARPAYTIRADTGTDNDKDPEQ